MDREWLETLIKRLIEKYEQENETTIVRSIEIERDEYGELYSVNVTDEHKGN